MSSRQGGSPDRHVPITSRAACALVALAAVLASCGGAAPPTGTAIPTGRPGPTSQGPGTPGPVPTGTPTPVPTGTAIGSSPGPRTVVGTVTDTQGRPLPGANIWVETQLVVGTPGEAVTGADGRYVVTGLVSRSVYRAHAWNPVRYRDQDWCLNIAPSANTGSEIFAGEDGAVRDFAWRLSGPIEGSTALPNEDGALWGGTIRLFTVFSDGNYGRLIQLALTPQGPLVDGSTGTILTRTVDLSANSFALDIPLGAYRVSATAVGESGGPLPLLVAQTGEEPATEADFMFKPEQFSTCGSASGSTGIARGFLDVVLP